MNIAIVGGGISALSFAFYAEKESKEHKITIYEKESRAGGLLSTIQMHGFTIEAGADGFFEGHTAFREFLKEANLEHTAIKTAAEPVCVYRKQKLFSIPASKREFASSKAIGLNSKLKTALYYPFSASIKAKSTVESYFKKRVGKSCCDVFGEALAGAYFASTVGKLSVKSATSAIGYGFEGKKSSFAKALFKASFDARERYIFKDGSSAFVDELLKKLRSKIEFNAEIVNISKEGRKWRVHTSESSKLYDAVVVATPAYIASRLLKEAEPILAESLRKIEYLPLSLAALGYEGAREKAKFSCVAPSASDSIGVASIHKSFYEEENKTIFRAFIGGQREPLSAIKEDEELTATAFGALKTVCGEDKEPMLTYAIRRHKALPSFDVKLEETLKEIEKTLSSIEGLTLCSSAYAGATMNECVMWARERARSLVG